MNFKEFLKTFPYTIVKSYSQIFFSDSKLLGLLLLIVSFFDIWAGTAGVLAVIITNLVAYLLGFNISTIKSGTYAFNSLMVGLGIGLYYKPGYELLVIILAAAILTLFVCILLEGVIGKYSLPFLSIPFILVMWVVTLSGREFSSIEVSERGIYTANEMLKYGGYNIVWLYKWWNDLYMVFSLKTYFLSLGAIFFQYNVLAGILISIGLLLQSRISFTLSLLGFYTAILFYELIGADISVLSYNYIGFNFILTSIAIGGFFVIPTRTSYLWVVILLPIVVLLTLSLNKIFSVFQLSIYSLPFNIIVIMFVYVLKLRINKVGKLTEVILQHNSPEKNIYSYKNNSERFKGLIYFPVSLPFWGEWTVSQAHNGEYTHKEDWKHAWDFVITDYNKKQFENEGNSVDDYYCYNKAILAPAAGYIFDIVDGIKDNTVGDINTNQNWGNSIVIKHAESLYSQLSHLKPGSFKVKIGDYVKKAQVIALCGNSGHSPYPHLHYQLQITPFIGSKTLDYPLNYYISKSKSKFVLNSYNKPKENEIVSNIDINTLISKSLYFIPGQKLKYILQTKDMLGKIVTEKNIEWEVKKNIYNSTYIYCSETKSYAYFYNDGNVHYFKEFIGNKKSPLYYFYLSLYKVQLGYYKNLIITDYFPLNKSFGYIQLFVHDFFAPFFQFLKSKYELHYTDIDNDLAPSKLMFQAETANYFFNKKTKSIKFNIEMTRKGISKIQINRKSLKQDLLCVNN